MVRRLLTVAEMVEERGKLTAAARDGCLGITPLQSLDVNALNFCLSSEVTEFLKPKLYVYLLHLKVLICSLFSS
jgi:hypothetical protein